MWDRRELKKISNSNYEQYSSLVNLVDDKYGSSVYGGNTEYGSSVYGGNTEYGANVTWKRMEMFVIRIKCIRREYGSSVTWKRVEMFVKLKWREKLQCAAREIVYTARSARGGKGNARSQDKANSRWS